MLFVGGLRLRLPPLAGDPLAPPGRDVELTLLTVPSGGTGGPYCSAFGSGIIPSGIGGP
jgi:hypothetical protein